jgi:hypothetical protein
MFRDISHAFRLLRKSPGFTLVAVLTLGIGIGANITIFSMINAVLVRPLAAPQSEKLVRSMLRYRRSENRNRRMLGGRVTEGTFVSSVTSCEAWTWARLPAFRT